MMRVCLSADFAGFIALKHSIDALVLFRAFALENPQNRLKILPRLDLRESTKIRHCEANRRFAEAIQITRI